MTGLAFDGDATTKDTKDEQKRIKETEDELAEKKDDVNKESDNTNLEDQNIHEESGASNKLESSVENGDDKKESSEISTSLDQENDTVPASAVDGGRETSDKILYVGGLHKSVSEDTIKDVFSPCGIVCSIKLLNDKNRPGFNYAFVEFQEAPAASVAMHTLNGTSLNNSTIKINWAYQSSSVNSTNERTYNVFVGDLSSDVDDEKLHSAFAKFRSLKQAHVMWDMQTSRSRGYGFVNFGDQGDAELALQTMNGVSINGRAIRCNWASHKQNANSRNSRYSNTPRHFRGFTNNSFAHQMHNQNKGIPMMNGHYPHNTNVNLPPPQHTIGTVLPLPSNMNNTSQPNIPVMSPQSYDIVLRQTPSWQTTVYLGNIAHFTQQADLIPLLQNFGFIVDFKFHPEKGCAFVKYDSHERAALAIVQLAGFTINGRPLKCGWGKDRAPIGQYPTFSSGVPAAAMFTQGRP